MIKIILFSILIRILEYAYLYSAFQDQMSLSLFFERSVNYDTLLILLFSTLGLPIYLLLQKVYKKALVLFMIAAFLLLIFDLILTDFFLLSGFLMPILVFEFSFNDLLHVASTELNNNGAFLIMVNFLVIALFIFVVFMRKPFKAMSSIAGPAFCTLYVIGAITILTSLDFMFIKQKHFGSSFQYCIANSKQVHFYRNWANWKETRALAGVSSGKDFKPAIDRFRSYHSQRSFVSYFYPLLSFNKNGSTLAPFFRKSEVKPNIVIVISEGLSSSFSGTNTLYGSLTPFLDSLRREGLYWENFMSNLDRSAGVLPSLLASVPFGTDQRGFINSVEIVDDQPIYPPHMNLIQVLASNGYKSNFYYGGWSGFDNMGNFTKFSGFDFIMDKDHIDSTEYGKIYEDSDSWGYDDGQLFRSAIEEMKKKEGEDPQLQMFTTLSYHSPYVMADSIFFEESFQKEVMRKYSIEEEELGIIQYKEFACLLFADRSLKRLFDHFKQRDDYKNTIFIILGDHGGGAYTTKERMNWYRIPLVIYSDLLKDKRIFKGISSQIDVLPSLLELLGDNYGLSVPNITPFIGSQLDTSSTFTAKRMVPLNVLDKDRPNFILDDLIIIDEDVYTIKESFVLNKCENKAKVDRVTQAYNDYLIMNNYVISEKKILDERIQ